MEKITYKKVIKKFKDEEKYAIFDTNGKRISQWFDFIADYGLLEGESDYYIAYKHSLKAVFHKSGFQVTDWCTYVAPDGLVNGLSDYVYCRKSDIMEIYNKNGKLIWKLKEKNDESCSLFKKWEIYTHFTTNKVYDYYRFGKKKRNKNDKNQNI